MNGHSTEDLVGAVLAAVIITLLSLCLVASIGREAAHRCPSPGGTVTIERPRRGGTP